MSEAEARPDGQILCPYCHFLRFEVFWCSKGERGPHWHITCTNCGKGGALASDGPAGPPAHTGN